MTNEQEEVNPPEAAADVTAVDAPEADQAPVAVTEGKKKKEKGKKKEKKKGKKKGKTKKGKK